MCIRDSLPKGATVTTSVIQRPSAKINIDQSGQAPSKWTYEVAKKEYQIAQLEYERIKGLNKKGSASAYDVKRAQYAMEIAYAKIEEVRHQSKKAKEKAASRQGRAVTNGNASIAGVPTEPVYQGKTFSQWLATARHDRDDQTRITAISACTATAETDQQWDSLLALVSVIARERGTRFVGGNKIGDAYVAEIGYAMHKAPPAKALDFVYNEIKDGNKKSRNFCSAWVNGLWLDFGDGSVSAPETFQHLRKLAKAAPTLSGFVSEHLEEPAVIEILKAMLQSYRWMGERGTKIEGVLVDDCYDTRQSIVCLLYTSPSPRDRTRSRMPSSA